MSRTSGEGWDSGSLALEGRVQGIVTRSGGEVVIGKREVKSSVAMG